MTTVFEDNFDDGMAAAWELEQGWRVKQGEQTHLLCGQGHAWARLSMGEAWTDYSARFRLKLFTGGVHLNYRVSEQGRYFLGFRENSIYLNKEAPWGRFQQLAVRDIPLGRETWHQVEIAGAGGHLQVLVDEKLLLDVEDPNPLTHGSIALETLEDSSACVDGVFVTVVGPDRDEIAAANLVIKRYGYRLEVRPGMILVGQADLDEGRHNLELGLTPESFPQAEAFWQGDTGYGRRRERGRWLRLRPQSLPNFLHSAVHLLQKGTLVSGREEGPVWVLELRVDPSSLRIDPESFLRAGGGDPGEPGHRELVEQMVELTRDGSLLAQVQISREDLRIVQLDAWYQTAGATGELTLQFWKEEMALLPIPNEAEGQAKPNVEIPMVMLLLEIPQLGGWCTISHGTWAQRTIDQVKKQDEGDLLYAEVYDSAWMAEQYTAAIHKSSGPDPAKHHPLILGAIREDCTGYDDPATGTTLGMPPYYETWLKSDPNYKPGYFFSQTPYARDHHHYGGGAQGLKYEWYMELRGNCPSTTVGDNYYSARDWGYGGGRIKPPINRLTFTNAIEQYHRYSVEGKRNAYLMLGHAIHLLQDCGQPDHARVAVHIASSLTGASVSQYYCPILAAEAALIACGLAGVWCIAAAVMTFAAIGTTCALYIKPVEVGYENLAERWDSQQRPGVESQIDAAGVVQLSEYDTYFLRMSQFAHNEAKKRGLSSALGCKTLWLPPLPPVPSLKPDILLKSPEAAAFNKLTDALVPQIIAHSAGLIQLFYQIVNYPPILERVAIVQWEPGCTPRGFAFFKNDANHCLRYDAEWQTAPDGKSRKLVQHAVKSPQQPVFPALSPDRSVYFFLRFGPTIGLARSRKTGALRAKVVGRPMNPSTTTLRLTAGHPDPETGSPIDYKVTLHRADDKHGPYYWGEYTPHNCCGDPYLLALTVDGEDMAPHLQARSPNPTGSKLDPDPARPARVDVAKGHPFPWQVGTYVPNPDTQHRIWVSAREDLKTQVSPASLDIDINGGDPSGTVILSVTQRGRRCNWEPYEAFTNCPVLWELAPKVSKDVELERDGVMIPAQYTSIPASFGLQVDLTDQLPQGTARLTVRVLNVAQETVGTYTIKVQCTVKDGSPNPLAENIEIRVQVH